MPIVQERVRAAIKQHGGLRKAARALDISPSVLSELNDGKRTSASPRTLRLLGLKRKLRIEITPISEATGP